MPKKPGPGQLQFYRRTQRRDWWTIAVCDRHMAELRVFLLIHGFHLAERAPADYKTCTFCAAAQRTIMDISDCTCVESPDNCPVHKGKKKT
jgi:hypothetical protein